MKNEKWKKFMRRCIFFILSSRNEFLMTNDFISFFDDSVFDNSTWFIDFEALNDLMNVEKLNEINAIEELKKKNSLMKLNNDEKSENKMKKKKDLTTNSI